MEPSVPTRKPGSPRPDRKPGSPRPDIEVRRAGASSSANGAGAGAGTGADAFEARGRHAGGTAGAAAASSTSVEGRAVRTRGVHPGGFSKAKQPRKAPTPGTYGGRPLAVGDWGLPRAREVFPHLLGQIQAALRSGIKVEMVQGDPSVRFERDPERAWKSPVTKRALTPQAQEALGYLAQHGGFLGADGMLHIYVVHATPKENQAGVVAGLREGPRSRFAKKAVYFQVGSPSTMKAYGDTITVFEVTLDPRTVSVVPNHVANSTDCTGGRIVPQQDGIFVLCEPPGEGGRRRYLPVATVRRAGAPSVQAQLAGASAVGAQAQGQARDLGATIAALAQADHYPVPLAIDPDTKALCVAPWSPFRFKATDGQRLESFEDGDVVRLFADDAKVAMLCRNGRRSEDSPGAYEVALGEPRTEADGSWSIVLGERMKLSRAQARSWVADFKFRPDPAVASDDPVSAQAAQRLRAFVRELGLSDRQSFDFSKGSLDPSAFSLRVEGLPGPEAFPRREGDTLEVLYDRQTGTTALVYVASGTDQYEVFPAEFVARGDALVVRARPQRHGCRHESLATTLCERGGFTDAFARAIDMPKAGASLAERVAALNLKGWREAEMSCGRVMSARWPVALLSEREGKITAGFRMKFQSGDRVGMIKDPQQPLAGLVCIDGATQSYELYMGAFGLNGGGVTLTVDRKVNAMDETGFRADLAARGFSPTYVASLFDSSAECCLPTPGKGAAGPRGPGPTVVKAVEGLGLPIATNITTANGKLPDAFEGFSLQFYYKDSNGPSELGYLYNAEGGDQKFLICEAATGLGATVMIDGQVADRGYNLMPGKFWIGADGAPKLQVLVDLRMETKGEFTKRLVEHGFSEAFIKKLLEALPKPRAKRDVLAAEILPLPLDGRKIDISALGCAVHSHRAGRSRRADFPVQFSQEWGDRLVLVHEKDTQKVPSSASRAGGPIPTYCIPGASVSQGMCRR